MKIENTTFSLPGPMWNMSWGANAIYADDFGSAVSILRNTFELGARMPIVFESNQGRDHQFIGNVIKPLPPNTAAGGPGGTPHVNIGNSGCAGAPTRCDTCMASAAALQAQFLSRVPFNTSAVWKAAFPKLANLWQNKPCEAAGITVADNIMCFAGTLASCPTCTESNNSWVTSVCGGPAPPPAPTPSPCALPASYKSLTLAAPPAGQGCASMPAAQQFVHNKTDGAIYSVSGSTSGRVIAVDCCGNVKGCGAQPHTEPVVMAVVDSQEFSLYKNVVFDLSGQVGGARPAEIKLRKSGKCLLAGPKGAAGKVVLGACGGAGAKWKLEPAATAVEGRFVLSSGAGCVTVK